MPETGKPVEAHASFRFAVEIDGVNQAVFTECTLPDPEVEVEEVQEGGINDVVHKLPKRIKVGNVTLKRGITRGGDLLAWYTQVLEGKFTEATRQVTIVLYDSTSKPVARWNFLDAYPVRWKGPSFSAGDNALAVEELELTHHGLKMGG